jgi:SAM-dependent methyltransferase
MAKFTKLAYWQEKIRSSRRQLELDLLSLPQRRYFSPIYYGQYRVTLPLIQQYVRGRFIDLGCGDLPFRDELIDRVTHYDSLDIFPQTEKVTYVTDIQDMAVVLGETYDSAICLEVLEHVPDPFRATREIYRILTPSAVLILSVPHLSRLHAEPNDYYRYTRHGLRYLLEQAGFEILELRQRGGLLTFLGHQVSTIILGTTWSIPGMRQIAWFLNSWLIARFCFWLDQLLTVSGIFAAGYTIVAVKPAVDSSSIRR